MKVIALSIQNPTKDELIKIKPPGGLPSGGFQDSTGNAIINWGITALLIGAVILALFFFIWGGIQWITSGGDKTKVQNARNRMIYSIIGLLIAFLSFFIVNLIGNIFGADILTRGV